MPTRDRFLALLVAVLWGFNFVGIHYSLEQFPPLFCVGLRFLVLAIPTVLFIRWPGVRVRWWLGYGMGFGVIQFAFLYLAIVAGMPTGLASLVIQLGAPLTIVLSAVWLRDRITIGQGIGVIIALGGLGVIAAQRTEVTAVLPIALTVVAALGWAFANVCARKAAAADPFAFTMWMTVIPPVPVLALALLVEGPERIGDSLAGSLSLAAVPALLGLLYTVLIGTVAGTGIWTALITRNPPGHVAPYALLIPVTGFASAWLVISERPPVLDIVGGAIVVVGVLIGTTRLFSTRERAQRKEV